MPEHKDPADRKHMWERHVAVAEQEPSVSEDYKHDLPRYLHNAELDTLLVITPDSCDAALKRGWSLKPIPRMVHKKGQESHLVSTKDELRVALAHGWSEEELPTVEVPHKGKKAKADAD